MDYPTHVARLMGTKHVGGLTGLASVAEQSLDRLERSYQPHLLGTAQLTQHCCDLIVGTGVNRREHIATPVGESENDLPAIPVRRALLNQTLLVEAAKDAAKVTGIQSELSGEIGGCHRLTLRELVQHPTFGQRQRAAEQSLAQDANLAGVEATEPPDGADPVVQLPFAHQKVTRTPPVNIVNLIDDFVN
jgi:hypothetical protein